MTSPRTLEDSRILIESFPSVADAFFWFGASTNEQINERLARLKLAEQEAGAPAVVDSTGVAVALEAPEGMPRLEIPSYHPPVLCFDTETTGLKPAIVCQLAFVLVEAGVVTKQYDHILRLPNGVKIHPQAQRVHGISEKDCASEGVDAREAIAAFLVLAANVLSRNGRVVAHHAKFDVRALRETKEAHGMLDCVESTTLSDSETFCTLQASRPHSTLTDKAGRKKAFSNAELYTHFYGSAPSWAKLHNALDDVMVTTLNYAMGVVHGWW
jgi:DNA polymerase III epsilon subunit-like protein